MNEYDVIVVGGGPCGSSAARYAAERGARTIMIEEHPQIGIPEHCVGMMAATGSRFLEDLVKTMDERVVVRRVKARRVYSPGGRCAEVPLEDEHGVIMIERNLFDCELAKQAASAGAEVTVNTAVTGLLKENGVIKGVITRSNYRPEIRGKLVIAADGIRALFKGIARWEGMSSPDQKIISGLKWHLAGVKGTEPGILEFHLGSFCERGWLTLVDRGNGNCLTDISSVSDFEKIKSGKKFVISEKLRDCQVLRVTGFSHPIPMGIPLNKKVKDGLILSGDGAGLLSIDFAVASGRLAGQVAGEAIKDGDWSAGYLAKYEKLCQELEARKEWFTSQFHGLERFFGLPDEEIEKRFREREPHII